MNETEDFSGVSSGVVYSDLNFTCDPEDMERYNVTAWREACHEPLQPFMVVIQVFYALICVLGLCGNTLVIYVVLRYSKMQTVTNLYIFNLALADECFLVGESVSRREREREREIFVSFRGSDLICGGCILQIPEAAEAADTVIRNSPIKCRGGPRPPPSACLFS